MLLFTSVLPFSACLQNIALISSLVELAILKNQNHVLRIYIMTNFECIVFLAKYEKCFYMCTVGFEFYVIRTAS